MKQDFNKLYCTNRYNKGKIHIAEAGFSSESWNDTRKLLCNKKNSPIYMSLHKIFISNSYISKTNYNNLCKNCIKKLSKENQEILKYRAIVSKLKG